MTEQTTTPMQEQAKAALDNQRPPLDAIAEDLVTAPVPSEPKATKAPEPTPQAREAAEPVEEPNDDVDAAYEVEDDTDDGGEEREEISASDFMDDLFGDEDPDDDDGDDRVSDAAEDQVVHRVTVDGETKDITLGELKRNFSAEGAIDKRLQDATEIRNRVSQEAEQYIETAQTLYNRLNHVYQHYNGVLFAPMVSPPPQEMRETDPIGYSHAMEDYRADQDRIQLEQQQMQQTLAHAQQLGQQHHQNYMAEQAGHLRAKFPGLGKRENATAFKQRILDIGAAHGFTPDEISTAADHRLLSMAAEAAAYRELKASMGSKRRGKTATVKHRPMPTRGNNRPVSEKGRKATQRRKVTAKARETGTLDDVAATLIM